MSEMELISQKIKGKTMNKKNQITTHFEYLGYEVNPSENEDHILFCVKPSYTGLIVDLNDIRINFYSNYEINRIGKCNPDKVLRYVNDLNTKSSTTTFYVKDDVLAMSTTYTGKYDRSTFAAFLSALEYDVNNLLDLSTETTLYIGDPDQAENYLHDNSSSAFA